MIPLQEDVYRFLGYEIEIVSNSQEVLTHLRSIYGRFYQDCVTALPDNKRIRNPTRLRIEITDNLATSNELLINDSYYLYQISRTYNNWKFTCLNLRTLNCDFSGVTSLLNIIQAAILHTISHHAKEFHLFHAGAVSWKNRGIFFPASSNMGKTTLVLKLVMYGCKFLSDEAACFHLNKDPIEPFPRKVNIRHGSQKILGLKLKPNSSVELLRTKEWVATSDIEDIVPDSLSHSCVPHYILFLRGFGDKPRFERISKIHALFELLNSSIGPIKDRAFLLLKFASLLEKTQCSGLVMGNIDETAEFVMQFIDQENL